MGTWADDKLYKSAIKESTPEALGDLAASVFRARSMSEEALKPLREGEWRRAYLFLHDRHDLSMFPGDLSRYPYDNAIFLPIVREQIETIKPQLTEALLENKPLTRVKPLLSDAAMVEDREKYLQYAQRVECLLHNQFVRDIEIDEQLPLWIGDATAYGTKWLFIDWVKRRGSSWRQVPTTVDVAGENGTTAKAETGEYELKEFKDELLEDHVRVRGESIWKVFPDPLPSGGGVNDCRYVQREMDLGIDTLWQWIEGTKDSKDWKVKSKDGLKSLQGSAKGEHNILQQMRAEVDKLAFDYGKGYTPQNKESRRRIRILDHWERDWHVIVAGNMPEGEGAGTPTRDKEASFKVLLVEPNPFKKLGIPFVKICPIPEDGETFGVGTVKLIEQLVHLRNILENLRLTNLERGISQTLLINDMAGLDVERMELQPSGVFTTDGSETFDRTMKVFEWPMVSQDHWRTTDQLDTMIQRATGGSSFQQGNVAQGFNDTARGIGMMLQAGSKRFKLMAHYIGVAMTRLAEAVLKVDQQFITKGQFEKVTNSEPGAGDKWDYISVDDIAGDYALEYDVSPQAANKGLQAQQLINAIQVTAGLQGDDGRPVVNGNEVALRIFRLLELSRPEQLITTQWDDAANENAKFIATGKVGPPDPDDDHEYHIKVHNGLVAPGWVTAHGPQGEQAIKEHQTGHIVFKSGIGSPGAPGMPPPGGPGDAGGTPPAPGAPPGGVPPSAGAQPPVAPQAGVPNVG